MDSWATDFRQARIVFRTTVPSLHPESVGRGYLRVCRAAGRQHRVLTYAAAVFEGQNGLATPDGATLTLNSAVTKAGQDPAKMPPAPMTPEVRPPPSRLGQAGPGRERDADPTLTGQPAASPRQRALMTR